MDSRQIRFSLIALGIVVPVAVFIFISYLLIGSFAKANIRVDAQKNLGPLKTPWRAIAQGGEQSGVRMLQPVTSQLRSLFPEYIRIDHLYDFYNVVSRGPGGLSYDWTQLDQTVCDIYASGAKPFFALGYMPGSISSDGSVVSPPSNWDDWRQVVQKTIERYSGQSTILCGGTIKGDSLTNIYYEVWNEPDLESFGKWSVYGGAKSYMNLYEQSVRGAQNAQSVQKFYIGGPSTTAPYRNWMRTFLDVATQRNLRVDFISWHRYSQSVDTYADDMKNINDWMPAETYSQYRDLPKIITEWGFDPAYNPVADGPAGAAHIVGSVRNFLDGNIAYAFTFEAHDGDHPSHGILAQDGTRRARFEALKLLNLLEGDRVGVDGESNYVKAIAAKKDSTIRVILANYDPEGKHGEQVPLSFSGLEPGTYQLSVTNIGYSKLKFDTVTLNGEDLQRVIYMSPNHVSVVEITKI
ncbi:hypothetical protein HYS00_00265 [Candidatus Microgenomates bacterium]|nr:hypothetical protein [Candidatus Microgenomates bacterium]